MCLKVYYFSLLFLYFSIYLLVYLLCFHSFTHSLFLLRSKQFICNRSNLYHRYREKCSGQITLPFFQTYPQRRVLPTFHFLFSILVSSQLLVRIITVQITISQQNIVQCIDYQKYNKNQFSVYKNFSRTEI